MIVREIAVKDYLTKSNLPDADFVINPYVGCTHACKYCYACFMKRFTGHDENWGTFLDVKRCDKPINLSKIKGKKVFLSSVTDCYNEYEKKYCVTQGILNQLTGCEAEVSISTKSSLILRDLDILKQIRNLKVSMSINTLDESFRADMDHAVSIKERLETLKNLYENGIYTILFMSPIFPCITDWKGIIETSREYIDEYWFENLNLRGSYKTVILDYVAQKYAEYMEQYKEIYIGKCDDYWDNLADEMKEYCDKNGIPSINYFYHRKLVDKMTTCANKTK
ncbi:MAG: radical SAM protein [Eubacteriales bacterium]|nr:radical SAM protein [Eubacteriales bacterium]